MRLAVYALLTAVFILSPSPAFSKGKKPPPPSIDEESEMPEEQAVEEESLGVSPAGKRAQESFKEDMETPEPEPEAEAMTQEPVPPQAASEDEPPARVSEGSKIHVVWIWQESRDCLWRLADQYYGDPWQWKKIYQENRNSILDPGIIFPKQRIIIPPARAQ